jgi:hypothetical protein
MKFRALVTPVIRIVLTTAPEVTLAVRMAAREGAGAGLWGDRRCHQMAAATISSAMKTAPQMPALPGFFGCGCTTSGRRGGGEYGATLGADATLMAYYGKTSIMTQKLAPMLKMRASLPACLAAHRGQELGVAAGFVEFVEQQLDGFHRR